MLPKSFDAPNRTDRMVEMLHKSTIVTAFVPAEARNGIPQKLTYDNVSEYYDTNICWYAIVLQICC